jgi:hypothetical protein
MLSEIACLLNELKRSRFYRGIVWAGGYPDFTPTPFSDIDLYAITTSDHHHHWVAERFGDRRVELTFFSRSKWETVLKHDARHPKHHFTFMHGEIIHDPEGLCEEVRQIAFENTMEIQSNRRSDRTLAIYPVNRQRQSERFSLTWPDGACSHGRCRKSI